MPKSSETKMIGSDLAAEKKLAQLQSRQKRR